jgi:hypothetical protein
MTSTCATARVRIEVYEDEIERTCGKLADFKIFRSFPSAAAVYAPLATSSTSKSANRHSSQENKFVINPLDGPPQGVS